MDFFKFDPSQPILRYSKWFPIYLNQLSVLLLYSWMLLNNYQLTKMLLVRDHWQITFITLNRFCALIKRKPTSLFFIDNIKLDGVPTKIKWKIHTFLYFKFKVHLIKIYKIQPPDLLFIVVLHYFFSRYHFSQIFRTSFNIIWKNNFRQEFSFSNGLTNPPSPPPLLPTFS